MLTKPWVGADLRMRGSRERAHRGGHVIAVIPAHNEGATVQQAVEALATQARVPDEVIVVADNCTDDTAARAMAAGARVVETVGNVDKKAGALNQVLRGLLPTLDGDDVVLVQDADSFLDQGFIEGGLSAIRSRPGLGAVGGTFRGQPAAAHATWSARVLAHLQDNEYARYARDVRRLKGKCLVVTGTAAMFRVDTLAEISAARLAGRLPPGDGHGGIYDTSVLTEDNELSFAVMTLGNVTLRGVNVGDALLAEAGIAVVCPKTTLEPTESMTCVSAPYTITQADANAGHVANTAVSRGTAPNGSPVVSRPSSTLTRVSPEPRAASSGLGGFLAFTGVSSGLYAAALAGLLALLLGLLFVWLGRRPREVGRHRS